jgi:DNA polymerase-3 subunit delta
MRLKLEQLPQQLSKGLLPIYIVSGDEPLLIQEACDHVRTACRSAGFTDCEVMHVDNSFSWNDLLAANSALSLFSDRKLIELRLPTGKPGDGSKALVEYAENASPDNVLLIICGKIESATSRSKWYQAIEKVGAAVQVWPVDSQQLPRWIDQRLRQAGLNASPDAINLLADRVEGNLLAAVQEIEKLKLFCEHNHVDAETVSAAVADNARYDIFGLVDNALNGDSKASLKMLRGLQAEGSQPTVVLWALARELRTLYQCAEQVEQGLGIDRALQNNRVWDRRKPITKTALKRLQSQQLGKLLQLANRIDQAVKGINQDNEWDLLEQLLVATAAKPALPLTRT